MRQAPSWPIRQPMKRPSPLTSSGGSGRDALFRGEIQMQLDVVGGGHAELRRTCDSEVAQLHDRIAGRSKDRVRTGLLAHVQLHAKGVRGAADRECSAHLARKLLRVWTGGAK